MPIPKAHAGTVAHAFLWTCGPWPKERQGDREWYQRVHDLVGKHFAVNLKRGQTTVAFETGQDGYNNCHVVVGHSKPTKFNMGFCKALKALCVEEEDRKINCAANVTLRGDKQAAKVGSYECMRRYLCNVPCVVLPGVSLNVLSSVPDPPDSGGNVSLTGDPSPPFRRGVALHADKPTSARKIEPPRQRSSQFPSGQLS